MKVRLNQKQNIALVSFAFDIGRTNFIKSKFLQRLNSGEDPVKVAEKEMFKWVYVTEIGPNGQQKEVLNESLNKQRMRELAKFKEREEFDEFDYTLGVEFSDDENVNQGYSSS